MRHVEHVFVHWRVPDQLRTVPRIAGSEQHASGHARIKPASTRAYAG